MIAIKFSVRGRDLGSAVDEAKAQTKDLFQIPYRAVWSGEFEQMEEANGRLMWIIPLSLGLIFILLYSAFRSFLDTIVIFSNVFDVAVGGIWSLYLTGTNFSVSAAVGFVSLFGIAIMEGLLLISYFNALRAQGLPLHEAIIQGAAQAGAAGDDHRDDGHPGPLARGPVDQDRRPDGAAAGHRRGRRHDRDAVPGPLPDAGALQLLRPPRAAGRQRRNGPLSLEFLAA